MQYGSPEWQGWALSREEAMEHIKAAQVLRNLMFKICADYIAIIL